MARRTHVNVEGHEVLLSNLEKVLYPDTGTTKADVLAYYAAVAPVLVAHAHGRPATLKRWVNGVGTADAPRASFFQKNVSSAAPEWVRTVEIDHSDHANRYPLVDDAATLTWLAQLAALEIHTPQWRFGPRGARHNPDRLVIDLDPGEGVSLPQCAAVAILVRSWLEGQGLTALPVTSGSKGIHLYAPLDGSRTSAAVSDFAHECARAVESEHRDLVVSDMAKKLRPGKVLIDWSQNNGSKTTIAPYSLRGRFRPTVAAPRTWSELESPGLDHLEFGEVIDRLAAGPDPLAALLDPAGHERPRPRKSRSASGLEEYRRKRNAARTSEPMPSAEPTPGADSTFVIQEHHARRLHWDFRLEHDGVLVSWALPKGVPSDPRRNHLAVRTEDHPLEYADFEGTIAPGEYGAGTVEIWDSGSYDLHKWREDEEVIVTLHGRPDGGLERDRTFALIHTDGDRTNQDHWLIHEMARPPSQSNRAMPYRPMLASAEREPADGKDWRFEMKWDGVRAICDVGREKAKLWGRNGSDLTASLPELAAALPTSVRSPAVLDGEVIAVDENGRPSFSRLQERLGVTAARAGARARRTPVSLMVFDVLEMDGTSVLERPYLERRALLQELVIEGTTIFVPPDYDVDLETALEISRSHGLEGVVAKLAESTYQPGRRSGSWLKVKHQQSQEAIIIGWIDRSSGGLGSLVVAVPGEDGALRYAGRVGSGLGDDERAALLDALRRIKVRVQPVPGIPGLPKSGVHWVKPQLVAEVRFSEWTPKAVMRHPVWLGLRVDKTAADVVAPARVA